jgi:homogentisate 1,2-dioxygenase
VDVSPILCIHCSLLDSVRDPDIQEIFGSSYELPELGPLGAHGLANPRDFETPVASFDIDATLWESKFWELCYRQVANS